jgi:hypothetical protein
MVVKQQQVLFATLKQKGEKQHSLLNRKVLKYLCSMVAAFIIRFTTEAQRAQSKFSFCPIGRRQSGFWVGPKMAIGSEIKSLSPQAMAFFPGRNLPARENIISSVASVSPWFDLRIFIASYALTI